jgi:O-antigen/teichoic acid export membrane protein
MMQQFFRHGLIYALASAFSGGLNLILLPIYARSLSLTDYGILELLMLIGTLVNLTVGLEVLQGVARFFPEARDEPERVAIASSALWFSCLAYGVFAVIALGWGSEFARVVIGSDGYLNVWQLAVFAMVVWGLYNLTRNQLRFQLRPLDYALANLSGGSTTLILAPFLVRYGISGALIAQTVGSLVGTAYAVFAARGVYRLGVDIPKLREMLRFSSPLVFSSVGVWLALYVDRVMISRLLGIEAVGVYAVAYRIATVVSVLIAGFQGALTPLVYTHHRDLETPAKLARVFVQFAAPALAVVLILSLFSFEVVMLVATPEYARAAPLIPLLTAAVVCTGVYVFAVGLGVAKRTRTLALVNLGAAGLNLALNLFLIPKLGLIGSSLATLVSAVLGSSAQFVLGQRFYPVSYPWSRIGLTAAGVVSIGFWGMSLGLFERVLLCMVGLLMIWAILWRSTAIHTHSRSLL